METEALLKKQISVPISIPETTDSFPETQEQYSSHGSLHRSRTAPALASMEDLFKGTQPQIEELKPEFESVSLIKQALTLLIIYLILGVSIYSFNRDNYSGVETHPVVDALYFCIITMCTIGYGDITPLTPATKVFTCVFVLVGFGFIDILLCGVMNYVLDLQENMILTSIQVRGGMVDRERKFSAKDYIYDAKKGRMRIRMKVGLALGVVVSCIGTGFMVLCFVEELDWVDSIYLSVMSVTTVGYGDRAFTTLSGRLFASFWLLFSTLAVGRAFLYLAEARIDKRQRRIMKWALQREITVQDVIAADVNNNGFIRCCCSASDQYAHISALGDPGMKRDGLRVAFEAWNFCNEVAQEALGMGSPRAADCFDLETTLHHSHRHSRKTKKIAMRGTYSSLKHKVTEADNKLGVGTPFPGVSPHALNDPDLYAAEKELYLGSLCEVEDTPNPWQFWMIMLKNGNYDTNSGLCPENGKKTGPFPPGRFPCFGAGCMNQPTFSHQRTSYSGLDTLRGGFNGTYELGYDTRDGIDGISFYEVVWEKKVGVGSWIFHHKLKTSKKYPWLMLYLRADATKGFSGGYHYDTRGMMKKLPEGPDFKVRLTLDVKKGGGPKSQFYLIDIGSCWKNNGAPCDGDVLTDVTRYSEMIINPQTPAWCSPTSLGSCPPYHITPNNTKIYRNNTAHFPYGAYHYYCAPGNAKHLESPVSTCDPYSNPQAQELVQLLPHPIWAEYGYPTKQGQGWEGDPRTWELDVGGLSSRLYFYQDPGTKLAKRKWTSLDVGTEVFVSDKDEVAEWTLSDFDVILT